MCKCLPCGTGARTPQDWRKSWTGAEVWHFIAGLKSLRRGYEGIGGERQLQWNLTLLETLGHGMTVRIVAGMEWSGPESGKWAVCLQMEELEQCSCPCSFEHRKLGWVPDNGHRDSSYCWSLVLLCADHNCSPIIASGSKEVYGLFWILQKLAVKRFWI